MFGRSTTLSHSFTLSMFRPIEIDICSFIFLSLICTVSLSFCKSNPNSLSLESLIQLCFSFSNYIDDDTHTLFAWFVFFYSIHIWFALSSFWIIFIFVLWTWLIASCICFFFLGNFTNFQFILHSIVWGFYLAYIK